MDKGTYYTFAETNRASTADTLVCFNCHLRTYYESSSSHAIGSGSNHNVACWQCHGSRVHGIGKNHLIIARNTGVATYHPDYEAKSVLSSTTAGDPTGSNVSSCGVGGRCGEHPN
jgi:hypothetical protein